MCGVWLQDKFGNSFYEESSVPRKFSSIIVGRDGINCGNCAVVNLLASFISGRNTRHARGWWREKYNALWVRLNVKLEIGKCLHTPHFIRVQIFQIDPPPQSLPFYPHPNISD